jgi:hypothetical protein
LKQFKIEQTELSTYFENVHYLLTNLEPNQIDRLQRDMFKKSLFKFEKQHSHFFYSETNILNLLFIDKDGKTLFEKKRFDQK